MEHKIELKEISCPNINVLEFLHNEKFINHSCLSVLKTAFQHNCYIAGGFSAAYATSVLLNDDFEHLKKYTRNYSIHQLNSLHVDRLEEFQKNGGNYLKQMFKFDIDVWFETHDDASQFLKNVHTGEQFATIFNKRSKIGQICKQPTVKGWGHEFACFSYDGNANLVQAITKIVGSVSQITNNFDIYNAACVIKDNKLFVPTEFEELLRKKQLKVNNFDTFSPYVLLKRINKWRRNQVFSEGFVDETRNQLTSLLDNLIREAISTKGILSFDKKSRMPINATLKNLFKPMIDSINDETLLKLSSYFVSSLRQNNDLSAGNYDIFFRRLVEGK